MLKRHLPIWIAVIVGSTGLFGWRAKPLLALTGGAAMAREHGRDGDDDDDRHHHKDKHHGHDRFDDDDRHEAHEWYEHHRERPPEGFRDGDRFAPEYEGRLRYGYVLEPDLRRRCHPVPEDLEYRLPPPPRYCRYVVIGGHLCLIDNGYRVHDVIHFEFNLN